MSSDLLSIGKSGLLAAQVGIATTGHNIANANVDGYNRQTVIQSTTLANKTGYGFVGTGTTVAEVKRVYDSFLATQVNAAQASASQLDTYTTQITQVDNLLSDTDAGLSSALAGFFAGVQNLASDPSGTATRQSMLSASQTLATRFQSISARLNEIGDGVNSEIQSSVSVINSYATQIAALNASIVSVSGGVSAAPNDLLDQRDQLVTELNKYVKATTTVADNGSLTVSFGSGQPLVAGSVAYQLAAVPSLTDANRMEIGYVTPNKTTILPEDSITGGSLGGLLEFRAGALDDAQNSLGRTALSLALTFNAQSEQGQDLNGDLGTAFFAVPAAVVTASSLNNKTSTTQVSAVASDASALTTSNYSVKYTGGNYIVTRESDGQTTTINPYPQTGPQTIDGVDFNISGNAAEGDTFEVKPTANGAASFAVALTDLNKIAAAAPISTAVPSSNTGSGAISLGSVDSTYTDANKLTSAVTMTYDKTAGTLNFSPATADVTVTPTNGTAVTYPAGTAVPYTEGADISFGGVHVAITGSPAQGDTFTVGPNTSGVGDSRNAALLGALQTTKIMDGGKSTFSDSYAATVSAVGNKTREAQINGTAATALLTQVTASQQSVSGVNLDEEGANLLEYQRAYQANGKVMQVASTLFDTLLQLGN